MGSGRCGYSGLETLGGHAAIVAGQLNPQRAETQVLGGQEHGPRTGERVDDLLGGCDRQDSSRHFDRQRARGLNALAGHGWYW
jgi:hypothetical protein